MRSSYNLLLRGFTKKWTCGFTDYPARNWRRTNSFCAQYYALFPHPSTRTPLPLSRWTPLVHPGLLAPPLPHIYANYFTHHVTFRHVLQYHIVSLQSRNSIRFVGAVKRGKRDCIRNSSKQRALLFNIHALIVIALWYILMPVSKLCSQLVRWMDGLRWLGSLIVFFFYIK